ncbi:MAG: hypothetical protein LUC37_05170, partial [Prevotella sp.]|nr:hypothetical protein [Prevotella sp.]
FYISTESYTSGGKSNATFTNITGDMLPLDFTHLPNYDDQSNLTSDDDSITISNPSSNAIFLLKNVNQYLGLDPSLKLEFDYHLDGSYLVIGLRRLNMNSIIPFYLQAAMSSVADNGTPLTSLNDLHLKLEIFESKAFLIYPIEDGFITAKNSFSCELSEVTFTINLSSSTGSLTNYSGGIPYSLFMDESNWTNVEISDDTIITPESCWFSAYSIADFFADFKEGLTGTIEVKDGKADLSGIITVTTESKEYTIHADYKGTDKYLDGEGTGTLRIN